MNWSSLSFDWNQARAFLAVAEERSLSAAAEVLGVTQPTISRQIAALEKELKVVLFERAGRSVSLTPVGLNLIDHVRAMARGANMVSLAASGQAQAIEGLVRISAADMTAAYVLPPMLDQLKDLAPNLELDILSENTVSDLLVREADIALRHARPEQPDLFAKLVCEDRARFYAVAKYIEVYGQPSLKDDHSQHQFVSFGDIEGMLGHLTSLGLTLTKQNFRYASHSQVVEWEIARQGHGVAIMTDRIACEFPEFEPVLTEIDPFTIPTWLVAHRELQSSRRIRLVFDLLTDCLSR
ncbi:LysR family transcriptional regulator [Tateyamaria omphalii]|uniref:LysR family transcriptional regulator n=1 Tax=Tateyamaria omphalii TaxID=299262 RepID=UPI00167899E3|nr:LysR family transcriptional regulator [Tateyamaria omphalii]GGX60994.1 LysR family transcriptional regulator [Tateyamaria omphalii]